MKVASILSKDEFILYLHELEVQVYMLTESSVHTCVSGYFAVLLFILLCALPFISCPPCRLYTSMYRLGSQANLSMKDCVWLLWCLDTVSGTQSSLSLRLADVRLAAALKHQRSSVVFHAQLSPSSPPCNTQPYPHTHTFVLGS